MRTLFQFLFGLVGWFFEKTRPLVGISLPEGDHWIVDPPQESAEYFRALIEFAPEGSVICLEGSTDVRFWDFAKSRRVADSTKMAAGTIWPRSDFVHVPATRQNLNDFASEIGNLNLAVPSIHTHVYQGDTMVLQWYDAFCDDPILICGDIEESEVRLFASRLGSLVRRGSETAAGT